MDYLDDIWRDVDKRIGFYTSRTADLIPSKSGIYAWYFPLRIYSNSPHEFVNEVNKVLNYDAHLKREPEDSKFVEFGWDRIDMNIKKYPNQELRRESIIKKWEKIKKNDQYLRILQNVVMQSTLLMPPLYVGRTNNLKARYTQHVNGSLHNDFHKRFKSYMEKLDIYCNVSDLLFVSVITNDDKCSDAISDDLTDVLEEIMKLLCKPMYGMQ